MKNICSLVLIVILMTTFSGCSKTAGSTASSFKISLNSITDITSIGNGGAMLWGRSDKGDMFGEVLTPTTGLELSLNNGQWTFWSVAWEGNAAGDKFTGVSRCAKNVSVLNGTSVQVSLNLSNANCDLGDFSPSVATNGSIKSFPELSLHECQKLTDHNGLGCGPIGESSKSVSRRLVMTSFKKPAGGSIQVLPTKLVSNCKINGGNFSGEHLPLSNGFMPAMTFLDSFYSSSTCDEADSKGFRRSVFEYGLLSTAKLDMIKFINEGSCDGTGFTQASCSQYSGTFIGTICSLGSAAFEISQDACISNGGTYTASLLSKKVELISAIPESEVCAGPRVNNSNLSPHPFAAGDGTMASPYSICTETQLNKIGSNASLYANSSFLLLSDLDMNKTSVFGDQAIPEYFKHPGANFMPIGGLFNGSNVEVASIKYYGTFDGNGHSISNIRLEAVSPNVGFIREGGTVKNLTLKNIDIDAKSEVGFVVGNSPTLIENVHVSGGSLHGTNNVGGIVGRCEGASLILNNLHVDKAIIQSDQGSTFSIGGLVGLFAGNNLSITNSSFDGLIKHHGTMESVGGLIGNFNSTGNLYISSSKTTGTLLTSGSSSSFAGGLAGNSGGGITVENSYSRMSIAHSVYNTNFGSAMIGGLVGYSLGSLNLNHAYYYGSIMLPCSVVTPAYCYVGALQGGGASGTFDSYSRGSITTPSWFSATGNSSLSSFEDATYQSTFVSSSQAAFKNVGQKIPILSWENDTCALNESNTSVAVQSASRGSLANPIILCNKEQWRELSSYSNLNYSIAGNLSIGDIVATDMPNPFNGSIEGNNLIVSGFSILPTTGNSALFAANSGNIKDIQFAGGVIQSGSNSTNVGVVGVNNATGILTKNNYDSIFISGNNPGAQGVVAGVNSGSISFGHIETWMDSGATNVGMIAGENNGVILGMRANGTLNSIDQSKNLKVGGIAGINRGIIQEVDTGVNINTANSIAGSYFGALIGENQGTVKDALIRPYASLNFPNTLPKIGHIFGHATPNSKAIRIVASNEIPFSVGQTGAPFHTSALNDSGATYDNVFALSGAVYEYNTTIPISVTNCSGSSFPIVLTTASSFTNIPSFSGFYFSNPSRHDVASLKIRSTSHVNSTLPISINVGETDYTCGISGLNSSSILYMTRDEVDFSAPGVTNTSPTAMKLYSTFCPSSSSAVGDPNYKCFGNEFDMVEGQSGGIGFNRLKDAYLALLLKQPLPLNRPVWVMDDNNEGFPKLFLDD
jgi:hypothetical protein